MGKWDELMRRYADVPYVYHSTSGGNFDCSQLVKATAAVVESGTFSVELVTVPNIELVEIGEDWETSTGLFTWELEDLQSAIASQEDPGVRSPVVKLGHDDPRWEDGKFIELGGQPAFGRLGNLRLTNNSQTLCGDLFGVPLWLARIMPTAYPRRSVEGWFNRKTRAGNTWPFVLSAVALLGTKYPAINTLEDLKILWGGEEPPLFKTAEAEDDDTVTANAGDLIRARRVEPVAKVKSGKVAGAGEVKAAEQEAKATTTTSDIQRAWYDQLEQGQSWWWIRQVLVNPLQLVVDDDDGGLYLVDVSVDASDEITYGEPQQVKIEYVAASDPGGLVEVHQDGQIVAASYEDAAASGGKPHEDVEAGGDPSKGTPKDKRLKKNTKITKAANGGDDDAEEEESGMNLSDDAIRRLGLDPDKATDEEVSAAILAQINAEGDGDNGAGDGDESDDADDSTDDGDDADGDADADADGDGTTTTTTPPVNIPEGMTLVDSAQWAEVQQGVAASNAALKKQKIKDRDAFIAAACQTGKFPRTRIPHYVKLWDADPKGTKVLIENLAPGLVPVTEVGTAGDTDPAVAASAYPDEWKRDKRVVAQRQSVSTRVKVVKD